MIRRCLSAAILLVRHHLIPCPGYQLTHQQAANALGCSVQTVSNWETGKTPIPWPVFDVMRIRNSHPLPGQAWKGCQIRDEALSDPAGNRYEPGDIASLFYLRPLVRTLQRELQERRRRDAPPPPEQLCLPLEYVKRWS